MEYSICTFPIETVCRSCYTNQLFTSFFWYKANADDNGSPIIQRNSRSFAGDDRGKRKKDL